MSDVDNVTAVESHEGIGPVHAYAWSRLLTDVEAPPEPRLTDEIISRRLAIRDLGRALRATADTAVVSEASTDDVTAAIEMLTRARELLGEKQREPTETASVDDPFRGLRMYSLGAGEGSPILAPLQFERVGSEHVARVRLSPAFEGPPYHVHGGVSAMLMDHVLGFAVASTVDRTGLTRRLTIEYRAPVPIEVDLIVGGVVRAEGESDIWAQGWIATEDEPSKRLVTAEGSFRVLKAAQAQGLVAGL
ncbi:PaaI family thioesterase [Gordonia sp. KTR9]|uniref:PaaI family thioesterase n=1 Tax=Gordonia sp. KTR9 TaxID=337191 RepID=UPI00027DDC11|nr:PaaI family thioesterase [Gordonia sp. KTR9]AFR48196.1 thioesterase superfamily protein [Gordonia sp. KTR9]